jgi:hypothetical protein
MRSWSGRRRDTALHKLPGPDLLLPIVDLQALNVSDYEDSRESEILIPQSS